jgi:hypothetical protein
LLYAATFCSFHQVAPLQFWSTPLLLDFHR